MAIGDEGLAVMRAFVIGPIGDEDASFGSARQRDYENALQVLRTIIVPACDAHGISVVRADQITKVGEITEQIYRYLRDIPLVIADLTGANPNVMYELGLRHSTGKLTIPIGEKGNLPFDVSAIRTILFERTDIGLVKARTRLITAIGTALTEGADPVTASRLWAENGIGSTASVVAEDGSFDRSNIESPEDASPGFLELIAELEEAMPSLTQGLQLTTSILGGISELFEEGANDASAKQTAGEKLRVANRVSQKLEIFATRLAVAANGITADIERFERGFEAMVKLWTDEEAGAPAEFEAAIASLSSAALESIPSAEEFRQTLLTSEYATKHTRIVYRRIAQSLEAIINASMKTAQWKDMLPRPTSPPA